MAGVRCYIVLIMNIVTEKPDGTARIPLKCARSPRANFAGVAVCTIMLVLLLWYYAGPSFFDDPLALLAMLFVLVGLFDICHYRADAFKPKPLMSIDRPMIEFGDDFTLYISFIKPPAELKLDICRGGRAVMNFDIVRPAPESELKLALPAAGAAPRGRWYVRTAGWSFQLPVTYNKTVKPKHGDKIPDVLLQTQLVNNMKGLD
ncbi:MAG: hypothetical protein AB7F40_10110 [Victivallaceae bacterium]|nr:hypothetical protein [Victivallaceae bacterium]